jgi:hypothetical protein
MTTPPEILFDRYFRGPALPSKDRERYKGKLDLGELQKANPPLAAFLGDIQHTLNEALSNEKRNVPEHVDHPPFHFDYIESIVPNALAFRDGDYSFIGLTLPLISRLWDSCVALSQSAAVVALLETPGTPEREEAILTVMCQTQLSFVVAHEYTHHVHGHLSQRTPGSEVFDEVVSDHGKIGNLEMQAFEIDADGYAVYHVLAHLVTGPRREQAIALLGCAHAPASMQDEILFSSFVMAIGAFLLFASPVDVAKIYAHTHPPPAARMDRIMHQAIQWCKQNDRSTVAAYMTKERFQTIMVVVERALGNPEHDWGAQTAFLKSEDGLKYLKALHTLVKAHVMSL